MITSAKYEKSLIDTTINTAIILVMDGQLYKVPLDPANRHYQMILEWVAEGNTIEEGG